MSDDTSVQTSVGELTWDETDLDEALARTKVIHRRLVDRRRRVFTAVSGLGVVLVAAVVAVVLLGGEDRPSRTSTDFAGEGDRPTEQPQASTPSTTAAPIAPQIGEAMTVRRISEIASFEVDPAARVVHLRIACETAGERIEDPSATWVGNALQFAANVVSEQPGTRCSGEPLTHDVALPDGVDPAAVTVVAARS